MDYIWFWTFWHWSKESFRSRVLLRNPLQGVAGHWDEWFRHEASETERRAIQHVGSSEVGQRRFISWLCRHWAPDAEASRNRLVARFVLGQLAHVPPFNSWLTFARYRASYGLAGVQAIVLAEKSSGEPDDIRNVESLILPADDPASAGIHTEGFQSEGKDLEAPLDAAKRLLSAGGLAIFFAHWIISGRRPYPKWLASTLLLGWGVVAVLILILWFGPEPGNNLGLIEGALVLLWLGLIATGIGVVSVLIWQAWRVAVKLRAHLENNQIRLRMNGGLSLKGGSAGLPFCLNILAALYRSYPQVVRRSWLWQRFMRRMCADGGSWAATGALAVDGRLKPVILEPKLRACLKQGRIKHILTPWQQEAITLENLAGGLASIAPPAENTHARQPAGMRLGFAAETSPLQIHRCSHLGRVMIMLGDFVDRQQAGLNIFALAVSAVMLAAVPDLRSVLFPHTPPVAVLPTSPSPYFLWLSLNTKHPEYFSVVLESDYWSNRRADVTPHNGITPSVRAEMHFHRLTGMTSADENDGVVWVERKRRFLTREFFPGERVGRYSIPYLSHLGHE